MWSKLRPWVLKHPIMFQELIGESWMRFESHKEVARAHWEFDCYQVAMYFDWMLKQLLNKIIKEGVSW